MSEVSFKHASRAVEEAVEFLSLAHSLVDDGKIDEAHGVLKGIWALQTHYFPTILDARDELAGVSDGVIQHYGLTGKKVMQVHTRP